MKADKDAGKLTFIGNNPSQRIRFDIDAEVTESGEALVSVADTLTALSTINDKEQKVRVGLGEDHTIDIHAKTVSVNVPVLDLKTTSAKPRAPKEYKGDLLSITVGADTLPKVFARAIPGSVDSSFPKLMMWVEGEEFCLMGLSAAGASFASAPGAKVTGSVNLVLWEGQNLKRIVGLAAGAKTVRFSQDAGKDGNGSPGFTITVVDEDTEFIVEQTLEHLQDEYEKARTRLSAKVAEVLESTVTTVTARNADLIRAMESAERVRTLGGGRDRSNNLTTHMTIEDRLLSVMLPDESFSEEIDAKTAGDLSRTAGVSASTALLMLNSLGPDAKATLHLPMEDERGKTSFAILTSEDTDLDTKVSGLPASGYWGVVSFRGTRR
jgi:hypothetical protein